MALIPRGDVEFDAVELKAVLAFLNSSFSQLQAEVKGRTTGGGMLELDVKPLSGFAVLDVKRLTREIIERLAKLFDKLDAEARRLGGADEVENVFGSELAKELTKKGRVRANVEGLFNAIIKEIDREVGRILGFTETEIEAIRGLVVEFAKRRLGRAKEARPTAVKGEEKVELLKPKKISRTETKSPHRRLDEFMKNKR